MNFLFRFVKKPLRVGVIVIVLSLAILAALSANAAYRAGGCDDLFDDDGCYRATTGAPDRALMGSDGGYILASDGGYIIAAQ